MVSIAAFQAVDPGSIPGRRSFFSVAYFLSCFSGNFHVHIDLKTLKNA